MKRYIFSLFVAFCCSCSFAQTADECLDVLYQRMPVPDSVDHSREFWQANVAYALQAKEVMKWGVPDEVWLQYVLPLRVSNEDLDEARIVMYNTLSGRVRGVKMRDAVAEVNHWCHEKVEFMATDSRISAPLATMKSAVGNRTEMVVFCVSALRAVGIPARAVGEEGLVEVWVDGEWQHLRACEPEPTSDNAMRLAMEDSVRWERVAQMPRKAKGDALVASCRGNVDPVNAYFAGVSDDPRARALLEMVSDKDRWETTTDVLMDHYQYASSCDPYIMNPRISNELLTQWRAFLSTHITARNIDEWTEWVRHNITVRDDLNPQHLCMSPLGVWHHRVTDSHSRDIFFVAGARSIGIPSRINEATGAVECRADGVWHTVKLD